METKNQLEGAPMTNGLDEILNSGIKIWNIKKEPLNGAR